MSRWIWVVLAIILVALVVGGVYFLARESDGAAKTIDAIKGMHLGYFGGAIVALILILPLTLGRFSEKLAKKDVVAAIRAYHWPLVGFLCFALGVQGSLDALAALVPVLAPRAPAFDNVEVNLVAADSIPKVDFTLTAIVSGKNTDPLPGHLGTARIQVPHGTKTISKAFVADCPKYKQSKTGPFNIIDGKIEIPVALIADDPPPTPAEQLPLSVLTERPTAAQLARSPLLTPKSITLLYTKSTPAKLHLWIFDWSDHQKKLDDPNGTSWLIFPFDDSGKQMEYSGFKKGTGWFSFFVRDEDGTVQYLGLRNLYNKPFTELEIKPASKQDQKCDAEFKEHE